MRCVAFLALLILGILIGAGSTEMSGQVLKTDPKNKDGKEEPKKPEWPKKVLGKSLDHWVKEMVVKNQPDASMRDHAIRTLPMFGPDARKAASKNLIEVLKNDPDINVKLTAIEMVPVLGFDDGDMDAGLAALYAFVNKNISTASNHTRYTVTMALGNCGPIARKAIPLLADWTLTDRSSWQNRKAACWALGRLGQGLPLPPGPKAKKDDPVEFGGPDVQAVSALAKRLSPVNEHSYQVRREAVQSLLLLGLPDNAAVWQELRQSLAGAFKDSDPSIQIWSRVVFIRTEKQLIKPNDPNLAAVMKFLDHEEPSVQLEAIQALGTIGNEATPALSRLIALATDPKLAKIDEENMTPEDRNALTLASMAIWALGQMSAETNKLVPILDELKRHKIKFIKSAAKDAYENLVRLGDPKFEPKKKDMKLP